MEGGPDELYTLRAQFWLGHYGLAIQEAKQVARRPLSNALKLEREEFLMRSYVASHQYDKVESGDTTGTSETPLHVQMLHFSMLAVFRRLTKLLACLCMCFLYTCQLFLLSVFMIISLASHRLESSI
jgi:hypothetical protein